MSKILYVEDSDFIRKKGVKHISTHGYEVITANNGVEALKVIDGGFVPDFIITDLLMPEMDGFQLMQKLKDNNNQSPVFVLTTDIQEAVKVEVKKLGALEIYHKPSAPEDWNVMMVKIKEILAGFKVA